MHNAFLCLLVTAAGITAVHAQNRMGIGYDEGLSYRLNINYNLSVQGILHFQYLGEYRTTHDQVIPATGAHVQTFDTTWAERDFGLGAMASYALVQRDRYKLQVFGQLSYFSDGDRQLNDLNSRDYILLRGGLMPELFFFDNNVSIALKLGLEIVHRLESTQYVNTNETDIEDPVTDLRFYGPRNPFDGSLLGIAIFFYL